MLLVLDNDTQISLDMTESQIISEETSATIEATSEEATSNESSVTSTGGVDTSSLEITESKEPWPEKGFESLKNDAFPTLVFGMMGIFIVLGLIALSTMALNKIFPGKKQ